MTDEPLTRERCYDCYRPVQSCFCDDIPTVDNRTPILILQHRRERFHAFNTARLVRKSLRQVELISDYNQRMVERGIDFSPKAGLLYPGESARLLSELTPEERPDQLVVIDGTWHHAKTMVRDIPALRSLPRYRLAPARPGRYRIRREPDEFSLSTIEATVAALRMLDPETDQLDALLAAFDRMVNGQLSHPNFKQKWRKKGPRTTAGVPRVLLGNLENVVVAYGEADPAIDRDKHHKRWPVVWAAQRLGSGEQFWRTVRPRLDLPEEFLGHLKLSQGDFVNADSMDEFRNQWQEFIQPADTLLVYNQSTIRLLTDIEIDVDRSIAMKSIDLGADRTGKTLDELMELEQVVAEKTDLRGRCGQRLANAVAWVEFLRHRAGQHDDAQNQ